jgi:predicted MFS family arabinose efflux permease/quinol monooxygenase YgiN
MNSGWAPFRSRPFAVMWTATVISNIGTWMYNLASGWLMLSLDPSALSVSLVQVANTLPMFLLAIPAGALVDIVDRRRFLIVGESATTLTSLVFAALVWLHRINPISLLVFTLAVTVGSAMTAPAWQAVVTQLVSREDLPAAVSANSAGINVSRAVGPALGGFMITSLGIAAPFWFDAFSNLGVIAALIWWRPPRRARGSLPPEPFWSAVRTGMRHARYNSHLRSTLVRAAGYFLFAGAYWALLPVIVREQMKGGPATYGILLAVIGASAVGAALTLPWLRARWTADRMFLLATFSTAGSIALFAFAHDLAVGAIASLIAGASWIAALSSLNLSAQISLPEWVRGRGLAVYITVMFGALSAGSALWGEIATIASLTDALVLAAAGTLATIPLLRAWHLQTGANVDFTPSLHWPVPITTGAIEPDRGPVLVTVEYHVDPEHRDPFLKALRRYSKERRRDGAYGWALYENPAETGRFIETFHSDSWLDHLRQHQRVTKSDQALQKIVDRFQLDGKPKTTHYISVPIA